MSTPPMPRRRVLPPVWFLLSVVAMVALHVLLPVRRIVVWSYRWIGIAPVAAGLAVNAWSSRLFERRGTAIRPFDESSSLVLDGLFRVSRNPMYLGMILALVGVGVLAGSLTPLVVVPVFAVLIDRRFIAVEESDLERTFGAAYADYKTRVRRWL